MSNLCVTKDGTLTLLTYIYNGLVATAATMHLYKNNRTPARGDVIGDYTECDFPGYSSSALEAWSAPSADGNDAVLIHDNASFVCSGGGSAQNVYGYFVTDSDGNLIWAQRYESAPFVMVNSGDTFTVTPKLTDNSKFP